MKKGKNIFLKGGKSSKNGFGVRVNKDSPERLHFINHILHIVIFEPIMLMHNIFDLRRKNQSNIFEYTIHNLRVRARSTKKK